MNSSFSKKNIFLSALAITALTACSSTSLNVRTRPGDVQLAAMNAEGEAVKLGKTRSEGTKMPVDFEDDRYYEIEAIPVGAASETHMPTKVRLDVDTYRQLPEPRKGDREFVFDLNPKTYTQLDEMQERLDSQGRWVVLEVKRRAFKDIAEAGGSVPALIYDFGQDHGVTGISIAPDGSRMVFSQSVYETQLVETPTGRRSTELQEVIVSKGSNLMSVQIGSSGLQHVTSDGFDDRFPSYTPDGDYIVFSSNRRRADLSDVLRVRSTGRSGISDIFVDHRSSMVLRPTVAANDAMALEVREAVRRNGETTMGEPYIWTVGGPNGYPTQITRGFQPAISPDGSNIAYIGDDGNLWVTATDGSNKTQLTFGARQVEAKYYDSLTAVEKAEFDSIKASGIKPIYPYSLPAWSPDGKYIAFTSYEGSDSTGRPNEDIWIMNFDGGSKRQLTTNGSADSHAMFSPDQKGIFFLSNRGQRWGLWRIFVDLSE